MARKTSVATVGKVLIADDHDVVRQGLAHVLRRDLGATQVFEAETFDEALERLADPSIVLAIFDLGMPGINDPRDLARVRHLRPDVRLVVLSGSATREHILAALQAGVHGYLVKSTRSDELVKRIQLVLAGEIYVPPLIAELPCESRSVPARGPQAATDAASLTRRQRDVLRLIATGLSNKEIAKQLHVAEGTVKMHVAAVLRAIGAKTRAHAAAIGRQFLA